MSSEGERIPATQEQIEALSKENPTHVYQDEKGRIAWNGELFDNEEHFKMYIRTAAKLGKFLHWVRNIFSRKK